ncbi:hypothetical protein KK141_20950 [Dyella sp. LX-66]|uniref:hypothetical protein n=1 Tax=unclassified Dyella TaxID=2634549 RepID=UPI001BDFEB0F|nr:MULTISPECIES: hypothetical protein [unclassified Dyella]MBT2118557.1 hypothetical protein [Dyella sp. LX-1]MBT2142028.1 hypothetical protein [Dyella sp. LX-66]
MDAAMKRWRVVLGVALAPAVLPLAYALASLLFSGYVFDAPGHPDKFFLEIAAIAIVCYGASYLLGAPVVIGLLLARRLSVLPCVSLSALVGAVAAVLIYLHYREGGVESGLAALLGACAAVLVSSVFCALAGVPWRRRIITAAA